MSFGIQTQEERLHRIGAESRRKEKIRLYNRERELRQQLSQVELELGAHERVEAQVRKQQQPDAQPQGA